MSSGTKDKESKGGGHMLNSILRNNAKLLEAAEGTFKNFIFKQEKENEADLGLCSNEDVRSMMEGAAMADSNLMLLDGHNVVLRKDHLTMGKKVKLMSGGRRGHEPLFTGYVGPGLLTAVVLGHNDHSAPSPDDIHVCCRELSYNHRTGIIVIVPNAYEEVVNFGLGIERARCDNILVDMVTIGDDCWESGKTRFGQRGLAGIVLAFKIAGAMAESLRNMKDIYINIRKFRLGTISCHLKQNAIIGTDLHGNSGQRLETDNICEIISHMLDYLLDPKKYFSLPINFNTSVIVLINSYTSERLFLYACVKEILEQLSYREVNVDRVYATTFVSGHRGFSISILKTHDSSLLVYADAPSSCRFWPKVEARGVPLIIEGPKVLPDRPQEEIIGPIVENLPIIDIPLMFICKALISSELVLNKIDIRGNFGTSITPAIQAIAKLKCDNKLCRDRPYNLLNQVAPICQDKIPNITGTIIYIFFTGAAQAFLSYSREVAMEGKMWVEALASGIDAVKSYTKVTECDLTIIGVLAPFHCTMEYFLSKNDKQREKKDWEAIMQYALDVAHEVVEETLPFESPEKKKGLPEVSQQATLIALTAIFEGIRSVTTGSKVFPFLQDIIDQYGNEKP